MACPGWMHGPDQAAIGSLIDCAHVVSALRRAGRSVRSRLVMARPRGFPPTPPSGGPRSAAPPNPQQPPPPFGKNPERDGTRPTDMARIDIDLDQFAASGITPILV